MNNEPLTGARRAFNILITIFLLIGITIALVSVWGDALHVRVYDSNIDVNVGFTYFIYNAWENVSKISAEYSNSLVTAGLYGSLILSIVVFGAAVILVYIIGIKALVKGIRGMINRSPCTIIKDAVCIAFILFAYFNLMRLFAFHSYGPHIFEVDNYGLVDMSITSGWGELVSSFFMWFSMTLLIIFICIDKFNKDNIPHSIRNIILGVTFFFLINLIRILLISSFGMQSTSRYNSRYFNLIEAIFMAAGVELSQQALIMLIVTILFVVIAIVGAILLLVTLVRHFVGNKEFKPVATLIYVGITVGATLVSMILIKPTMTAVLSHVNAKMYADLTSAFVLAIITMSLAITATALTQGKAEPVVSQEN